MKQNSAYRGLFGLARPPCAVYEIRAILVSFASQEEVTPSFKVNDRLNEWYDFGEATGGDQWNWVSTFAKQKCGDISIIERHQWCIATEKPGHCPQRSDPWKPT